MSDTSVLTGAEVSALLEELGETPPQEANRAEVRPFTLGQESFRPTARLAGLERMNERLARRFRTMIEPYTRTRTQVTAEHIETRRFEDWRADLPDFTSLSLYRMRPLKGGMLIVLEPSFIASLVDAFYGGSGAVTPHKTAEFTASEERLLTRLTDEIVKILVELWADVMPISPALASRETNAAYASLVRPDEAVVIQRFAITPATGRRSSISILYPLGLIRPIEAELAAKVHDDNGETDAEWRYRLAAALEHVRLPVRSVLARPEMSVAGLMALKPGDIIPISFAPSVPLLVGKKAVAQGNIGEQEGRVALRIEAMGPDKGSIA
jgi:flagellar motor switch protein FliM